MKIKNYFSFILWVLAPIAIGFVIGSLSKSDISTWYQTLNRSSLTPPNYVFPVVWTILYAAIGACGWRIWSVSLFPKLRRIKALYIGQLILNWLWSPLFFNRHFTGIALLVVISMDILVARLVWTAYPKIKSVSFLMTPYLFWLLFATYLNFYIWWYN